MIGAKVLGGARLAARPAARHAVQALGATPATPARRCPLLASSRPRRWASDEGRASDGAEKQHLRLLGLRMDSVKDARLTEDDLDQAFDNAVVGRVGHDSQYFKALEAFGALKQTLRRQARKSAGAEPRGEPSSWPAFDPQNLDQLGASAKPRPAPAAQVATAADDAAPLPLAAAAGDRVRVDRGSYKGKFATVVRPTAARYVVRLDRGGEVTLNPSSMTLAQAVNQETLLAARGQTLGPVVSPSRAPAAWAASAGVAIGAGSDVLASAASSAASELADLHSWLARSDDPEDWEPRDPLALR